MNPNAEFDLIVYGATGYTGRLVAEHLAQRYGVGGEVKWAMAGRSARQAGAGARRDRRAEGHAAGGGRRRRSGLAERHGRPGQGDHHHGRALPALRLGPGGGLRGGRDRLPGPVGRAQLDARR